MNRTVAGLGRDFHCCIEGDPYPETPHCSCSSDECLLGLHLEPFSDSDSEGD